MYSISDIVLIFLHECVATKAANKPSETIVQISLSLLLITLKAF